IGCVTHPAMVRGSLDYSAPVTPPGGLIFAHVKAPLTRDFNGNPAGPNATKSAQKEMESINLWPLFFFPTSISFGDIDIASIAEEGEITEISYADYEYFNVLYVYR